MIIIPNNAGFPSVLFDQSGGNGNTDNAGGTITFSQNVTLNDSAVVIAFSGDTASANATVDGVAATKVAFVNGGGSYGSCTALWIKYGVSAGAHTIAVDGTRYSVVTSASFQNVVAVIGSYTALPNQASANTYVQTVPTSSGEQAVQVLGMYTPDVATQVITGCINISRPTVARPARGGMVFNRSGENRPTSFSVYDSSGIQSATAVRLSPI